MKRLHEQIKELKEEIKKREEKYDNLQKFLALNYEYLLLNKIGTPAFIENIRMILDKPIYNTKEKTNNA